MFVKVFESCLLKEQYCRMDWRLLLFVSSSKLKTYESLFRLLATDTAVTVIVCGHTLMEMLQTEIQATLHIPALLRKHLLCRPMALNPPPVHLVRRTSRTLPRGETKHLSGDVMQIYRLGWLEREPCGVKICVKYSCWRKGDVCFTASHLLQRLWLKLALFSFLFLMRES